MPNRLARETSPYLLQHKDNPIDWYPWCEEAFQRARLEDKPVFLSVGYSSCHWCHVMAHESFEDPRVGEFLNRYFVCIKVDREERPDVDETYMAAVQLYAGRGGWPMSVFLTPERKPFLAGTYFPLRSRGQVPGFIDICAQIAESWGTRRQEIQRAADEFGAALRQALSRTLPPSWSGLSAGPLDACVAALHKDFDHEFGGFGPAPKFPPHSALHFLLAYAKKGSDGDQALAMACATLEAIALGGVHDHVGGGFHRYSTDERWLLPHFEKMLYDNAQLLGAFAMAAKADPGRSSLFERAASGIVRWLRDEMTSEEGLLYSAIDADSEGEEGLYYLWQEDELREILGARGGAFVDAFGVQTGGNYLDEATKQSTGLNVLNLAADPGDAFDADLRLLRERRGGRVRPGLDDKALAGWNGLAIAGLAETGEVEAARRCAEAWIAIWRRSGDLPHQVRGGVVSGLAFLEDYAYLAWGLLELDRVAGGYREVAAELVSLALARFSDPDRGGLFSTSNAHESLFGRTKPVLDNATPSPNGVLARCLARLGQAEEAERVLVALSGWMERAPTATETLHHALLDLVGDAPAEPKPAPSPAFTWSTAGSLPSFAPTGAPAPKTPTRPRAATPEPSEAPAEPVEPPKTKARLVSNDLALGPDGKAVGEVVITIPDGYHLNTNEPPARWLRPTELRASPMTIEVDYPKGEADEYRGEVRLPFRLLGRGEFELRLTFQMCSDRECLEPGEIAMDGVVR